MPFAVSLSGSAGVFTYNIDDTPLMVAVYWNVPLLGTNSFNVKVGYSFFYRNIDD